MKRLLLRITLVGLAVIVFAVLGVLEIYNNWENRQIYFDKEPQRVIHNVVQILDLGSRKKYIAVSYLKGNELVYEIFEEKRENESFITIEIDKAAGDETYIELIAGYREPMLWLKDDTSSPPAVMLRIYCGSNVMGGFCPFFDNDK